ncbi:MAG: hypothetical protein QF827_02610 [Alphaproteobacteria bacterium]|nr:hypothetical protein [Alphaproteobacteria bacterium]
MFAIADDIDADLDLAADARGGGVGDGAPRGFRVHRRPGPAMADSPRRRSRSAVRPFGHGGEKALARLLAIADDIEVDLDLAADARGGGVGDGAPRGARVHRRRTWRVAGMGDQDSRRAGPHRVGICLNSATN